MRNYNFTLRLRILFCLLACFGSLTAFADSDFTVRPSLEKHVRFSYNTETSAYSFVRNFPKDYTDVTGTYELRYSSGMVVLQEYTFPSDIDWSRVAKITLQTTVSATANGYAAYWLYDADAATTIADASNFGTAATSAIGITPGGSGTVNADAVTSYVSRTQVDDSHYTEKAEITGDKLATLISKLRGDSEKKIAFVITRQGATATSQKWMYSSNDANNTSDGDFRPVMTIDYAPVKNATNNKSYSSLKDALADLDATADENVIELYGDVTLDGRRGPSEGKTLTLKPMKDGITLKRGSLNTNSIWMLTNKSTMTLNIGSDDYKLTIDGENADITNSVLGCENGKMNVTNVEFKNFKFGTSGNLGKTGGTLSLKNVTLTDCSTETQFFTCGSNDRLALEGYLNQSNTSGTTINLTSGRIKVNGASDFAASATITINLADSYAKGSVVILGDAAAPDASLFGVTNDSFKLVKNTTSGHTKEIILDNNVVERDDIKISQNGNPIEVSVGDDGSITFTPASTGEFSLILNQAKTLDNSQAFYFFEVSDGYATNQQRKLRTITIDGEGYGYSANGNQWNKTLANGHKLVVLSPLSNDNNLLTKYIGSETMQLTALTLNINTQSTDAFTIYNSGFCNLGELLDKYPELKTVNFQFVAAGSIRIEGYDDNDGESNGSLRIKDEGTSTAAIAKLMLRSIGTLPSNYTQLDWGNMRPETPFREDVITDNLKSDINVLIDGNQLSSIPTLYKKVCYRANGWRYRAYKQGEKPSDVVMTGSATTGRIYGSWTGNFEAGRYYAMILPFDNYANGTQLPAGLTFYSLTSYDADNNSVGLTQIDAPTQNIPFIVKADETGLYCIPGLNEANTEGFKPTQFAANAPNVHFVGSYENSFSSDYDNNYTVDTDGKLVKTSSIDYFGAFVYVDDNISISTKSDAMVHDGALHTAADFERVKQNLTRSPWKDAYALLTASPYAQASYTATPQDSIVRGDSTANYQYAYRDAAAAYQLALRWHISDDKAFADAAVSILNAWAAKCTKITGSTDAYLAAGLYGYQFAVAAELMRDYEGWNSDSQNAFQQWMLTVFYPMNSDFLIRHNGTPASHYYANWGLANIASEMAIGILTDRRDIYNEAVLNFQASVTNGNINHAIYHVFDGSDSNLAQWQESNRDEGHTLMCQGLVGAICQLAWNQGDDFFGYDDNRFLKGCEYSAKYFVSKQDVPNVPVVREAKTSTSSYFETMATICDRSESDMKRPVWALPYYHYKYVKQLDADKYQYTENALQTWGVEGGGGNYGTTSGGFDDLGFGSLMYAVDEESTGIEAVETSNTNPQSSKVYDLSGRRMDINNLPKGVYIQNGKKIVKR